MIAVLFGYIALVGIEIVRNWCIIFHKRRRPTYWWSTTMRVAIAFTYWIVAPNLVEMNGYQWWGMLAMMIFTGWWVFDYGLNLFRRWMSGSEFNKPFYYLNPQGSFLDRLQCRLPLIMCFWFKLVLMVASLQVYFGGVNIVWNPGW